MNPEAFAALIEACRATVTAATMASDDEDLWYMLGRADDLARHAIRLAGVSFNDESAEEALRQAREARYQREIGWMDDPQAYAAVFWDNVPHSPLTTDDGIPF